MASTAAAGSARPHDAPLTCHMPFTTRHTSSASPALLCTVVVLPSAAAAAHRSTRRRRGQHRRLDLAAGVSCGTRQPVAAAIEMGGSLQFYNGGVFSGQCGTRMNHAITVVGYGADANTGLKYWLVKNSWGQSWGERGYLRMRRDLTRSGLCGIALDLAYPVV